MAATIEFLPDVSERTGERPFHSLSDTRAMGHIARLGFESGSPEHEGVFQYSFDNFVTATTENIATDKEYKDRLNLGTLKVRPYIDGHIRTQTGEPLIDIPENGAEATREMAEKDPSYRWQYVRDSGDPIVARFFDNLKIGENGYSLSYVPDIMEEDKDLCESIGYSEGMSILHQAYRADEHTVYTWTYAIKESDKEAFSQIFLEDFDMYIPPDTHSDLWSRHVHKSTMTLEEAHEFGLKIAKRHQEVTGSTTKYFSATEFMEIHRETLQEYFERYVVPLSLSLETGVNDPILKDLANVILQSVDKLKPEAKRGLMRVANKNSFDDDDATLMLVMIRYAAVEELRQHLPEFLQDETTTVSSLDVTPRIALATYNFNPVADQMNSRRTQEMNVRLAHNIGRGVAANRSVGGCSAISLSGTGDDIESETNEPYNNMFARADGVNGFTNAESKDSGACEYTISACYCCPYNSDGTDARSTYTVKIIRNEKNVATCTRPKCGATLDGKKIVTKGGIFERAQSLKVNYATAA